ncbi:MAG: hypothetical protein WCB19_10970 [Thermoplasmata archaeon]
MATSPMPPRPPHRWIGLLLTRRFWIVVGVVVVAALAVYGLVAIPIGPTAFSFMFSTSACGCQHTSSTNHTFPDRAYVSLTFTSRYLGNVSEYVLIITNPSGVEIVYANMVGGSQGRINYANTTETFTTTAGGTFEFTLLGASPAILPGITAWVNGTYNAPTLS